jgi:hypothetical protein
VSGTPSATPVQLANYCVTVLLFVIVKIVIAESSRERRMTSQVCRHYSGMMVSPRG